ncbi:MAG: hypothetical protein K0Q72_704 [Armatimonadetes bacterium]|jgi:hypothetical protein|nr:hypothetical protein [Armatimonadota bacterium]
MAERCDYCGCILSFKPVPGKSSLASLEDRQQITARYLVDRDQAAYQERLAVFGYREYWGLHWTCPGCESLGTTYHRELTLEEADACAAEQNLQAGSPAAVAEAAAWQTAIRRRAQFEAERFALLVAERLPDGLPHLERFPEAEGTVLAPSAVLRIPSANPAVTAPLTAEVSCGEIIVSWFDGWHEHVHRPRGALPANSEAAEKAMELLERVRDERLLAVVCYRDGALFSGSSIPADADLEAILARGLPVQPRGPDRIVARSFRGTLDRVYDAPFPFRR